MANTIDSNLQLTEVLDSSMRALKRQLSPLLSFSTVFQDVALKGDDTVTIPYYPLTSTGTSQTRAADGSYKALATGTTTQVKQITSFTNKVQALSFNSREIRRQPAFNPEMHGTLKGEALAYDVLADIFSVIRHSSFNGTTISATTAANFDEDDVADLRQIIGEEFWPQSGRSLILNPSFATNLLKQAQIIGADQRGDGGNSFRQGVVGRVLGFDVVESAGLLPNNTTAAACTVEADDNVCTAGAAHGLSIGDRIRFPAVVGGTGMTQATTAYYVISVPTSTTFTFSATAGGAAVNVTADATAGTTFQRYENIQGITLLPSSILVAFAPVPPTDGVRRNLVDYQELRDDSGLVLQYKRIAYEDTDEEVQTIECHYGYAVGDTAQLKIISGTLA
jgi:hypothetical protein